MLTLSLACTAPESAEIVPPDDEPVEVLPVAGDGVFSMDHIHAAHLLLEEDARAALIAAPYEQVRGRLTWDDRDLGDIAVRLRGGDGSFRPLDEKPKWKFEFDAFVDGGRLDGLERLALDNWVADCSVLRAPLALRAEALVGLPASRTGFTMLQVNGEDYGLYVLVEVHDEHFVRRNGIDGNLYDGSYIWEDGRIVEKLDLVEDDVDQFELMEGDDVGHADLRAVVETLSRGEASGIDVERLTRFFAAEAWVGHLDGYDLNQNNYEVAFDGGRASIIGWDYDEAFLTSDVWGMRWDEPAGVLGGWCRDDPACHDVLQAAVDEVGVTLDAASLADEIAAWSTLVSKAALADPRRECRDREVREGAQELVEWVDTRSRSADLDLGR